MGLLGSAYGYRVQEPPRKLGAAARSRKPSVEYCGPSAHHSGPRKTMAGPTSDRVDLGQLKLHDLRSSGVSSFLPGHVRTRLGLRRKQRGQDEPTRPLLVPCRRRCGRRRKKMGGKTGRPERLSRIAPTTAKYWQPNLGSPQPAVWSGRFSLARGSAGSVERGPAQAT